MKQNMRYTRAEPFSGRRKCIERVESYGMSQKPTAGAGLNKNQQLIAVKVRLLFETQRKQNGDKFTYEEVEAATKGAITNSWISKLANGHVTRPGLWTLKALTDFFDIDPTFWFSPLDVIPQPRIPTTSMLEVQTLVPFSASPTMIDDDLSVEEQKLVEEIKAFVRQRRDRNE